MFIFEYFCLWDRSLVPPHFPKYSINGPIHGIANSKFQAIHDYKTKIQILENTKDYPFSELFTKTLPSKCIVVKHNLDKVDFPKDCTSEERFFEYGDAVHMFFDKVQFTIDTETEDTEEILAYMKDKDGTRHLFTNLSAEYHKKFMDIKTGDTLSNKANKHLYRVITKNIDNVFDGSDDRESNFLNYFYDNTLTLLDLDRLETRDTIKGEPTKRYYKDDFITTNKIWLYDKILVEPNKKENDA